MDFYAAGAREARETFIKEADYADRAAKLWEHLQPTQTHPAASMAGAVAGGGAGGVLGMTAGRYLPVPQNLNVSPVVAPLVGAALGMNRGSQLGQAAVHKVHKMLTQRGRAGAIRKYTPMAGGAAAAIGATALAAGLAHHFLSRGDEKEAGFDFLSPEVAKYMRMALLSVPIATGAAMKYTMPKVPPPVVQPMKAPGAPPSLTASK